MCLCAYVSFYECAFVFGFAFLSVPPRLIFSQRISNTDEEEQPEQTVMRAGPGNGRKAGLWRGFYAAWH